MNFSLLAITALSATISSFMISADTAAAPRNRKVAKKYGGSSNGLLGSGIPGCWITIKGPPSEPSTSMPCSQVDVANINGAMTWNSFNAYLLSFHNLPDGTCAVVVDKGFTGPIPGGLVSPNGKFYLGPYSVADIGQAYAEYDTTPTIVKWYTEPVGATSYATTTDAPLDPTTVIFSLQC